MCSWILPVVTEKESRKKFYMKPGSSRQHTGPVILLCPQSDHPSCHGLCAQGPNHRGDMSGCSNSGSTMSKPKKNLLGKNTKCSGHSPRMVSSRLYTTLAEKQRRDEKTRVCQRFSDCGNSWNSDHDTELTRL